MLEQLPRDLAVLQMATPTKGTNVSFTSDVLKNHVGRVSSQEDYSEEMVSQSFSRRQRRMVPDESKDDAYWQRRNRNNEAAKISRQKRRMCDWALRLQLETLAHENAALKSDLHSLWYRFDRTNQLYVDLLGKHNQSARDMALLKSIITQSSHDGPQHDRDLSCNGNQVGNVHQHNQMLNASSPCVNQSFPALHPDSINASNIISSKYRVSNSMKNFVDVPPSAGDMLDITSTQLRPSTFDIDDAHELQSKCAFNNMLGMTPSKPMYKFVIPAKDQKSTLKDYDDIGKLCFHAGSDVRSEKIQGAAIIDSKPRIQFPSDINQSDGQKGFYINDAMSHLPKSPDNRRSENVLSSQKPENLTPAKPTIWKPSNEMQGLPVKLRAKKRKNAELHLYTGQTEPKGVGLPQLTSSSDTERLSSEGKEEKPKEDLNECVPIDLSMSISSINN
ncbi:putative nuclear factor interleukin-3-regulated protein-like [Apostichopus japonicus]|uniref:Putative nuclear factor interleukin-3-regulated protein-like n=1 Tax=Stichopus japonicus TaxID=307972 RepID=A0A2G8JV77_STIJA|nr:putative nuclear factor interleukin-3-regulated protein-like [Apostichopus japonicus]